MTETPRACRVHRLLVALIASLTLLAPSAAFGASTPVTPGPGNLGFTVTTPSPTPHTPSPSPTSSTNGHPIPNTGGPSVWWLIVALVLIALGAVIALVGRRRILRR